MTTTYTPIPKASGTSYTKISGGYVLYDDSSTIYDSTSTTYDGLNNSSGWTKIPKASGGGFVATAGMFMGVGSLTYSGGQILSGDMWTKIPKAT